MASPSAIAAGIPAGDADRGPEDADQKKKRGLGKNETNTASTSAEMIGTSRKRRGCRRSGRPMRQIPALATTARFFHRRLMARAPRRRPTRDPLSFAFKSCHSASSAIHRHQLAAVVHGPATIRPPLLIAHGRFGSARNWNAVAKRLALHRQVIAVDMRNHAESPRSPKHGYRGSRPTSPRRSPLHGGCADVLGHSMGRPRWCWPSASLPASAG